LQNCNDNSETTAALHLSVLPTNNMIQFLTLLPAHKTGLLIMAV